MITDEQVAAIEALHDPKNHRAKFCVSPRNWDAIATTIAKGIGLDGNPIRVILDLGCGFGYFVKVCRQYGHGAAGVEVEDPIIANAMCVLGVPINFTTITPYTSLPWTWRRFDFITMFGVNLHDGEYWSQKKYAFLAQDIRSRLNPGGKWVIQPNMPPDADSPTACQMSIGWWQEVAGPDARISTTTNHSFQVTIQWTK